MIWLWALPAVLFAAYAVHAGFKYTRMISNIFLGLVYTPDGDLPSSAIGERVTILDSADHEVEALVIESNAPRAIAVFCHESGSNKASWEKYAFFLPQNGYHIVAPDVDAPRKPDEPNSLTQWPDAREVERLEVVIRWARRVYGVKLPVVLFGVSKGANLALAAAAGDPHVRAIVADGLFSMREIFRDYIRKWAPILVRPNLFGENYPGWVVSLFAALGHWNCQRLTKRRFVDVEKLLCQTHPSLLAIHGELDDYVPASHQKLLEKIAGTRHFTRLQIARAGHNEAVAVARETYERTVLNFLETELG